MPSISPATYQKTVDARCKRRGQPVVVVVIGALVTLAAIVWGVW